jgi:hypothetical protein
MQPTADPADREQMSLPRAYDAGRTGAFKTVFEVK